MEGALEWRTVSTTSVEIPKSMRWATSEATPTVSITLGEVHDCATCLSHKVSLTGISHREPLRRDTRSENHTRAGKNRATSNRLAPRGEGEPEWTTWCLLKCKQAWLNTLQICSTTLGWSLHSPGLNPCLITMSSPWLRYPRM